MQTHKLILSLLIVALSACSNQPTPSVTTPAAETVPPRLTSPAQLPVATSSPRPVTTFAEPTDIPTPRPTVPTPTATPPTLSRAYDFVRDGTIVPQPLAAISPDNLNQLAEMARWGKGAIRAARYSNDGGQFAVATSQGVYLYETSSYDLVQFTPIELAIGPVNIAADLSRVVVGTQSGALQVWGIPGGGLLHVADGADNDIVSVALSPDGTQVFFSAFSPYENAKTWIWNLATGSVVETPYRAGRGFVFSDDGKTVAAYVDGVVEVWLLDRDDEPLRFFPAQESADREISSWTLSRDGSLVAAGTQFAMSVMVWRVADQAVLLNKYLGGNPNHLNRRGLAMPGMRSGPGDYITTGVAFSPDNSTVGVATLTGLLQQYRVSDGAPLTSTGNVGGNVLYSPGGKVVVSLTSTAQFFSAETLAPIYTLGNHVGAVRDVVFSPAGNAVAIGSGDAKLWLRRFSDGQIIRTYKGHTEAITDVDFSHNGEYIVSGSFDSTTWLWRAHEDRGQQIGRALDWVFHVSFSANDQWVAITSYEQGTQVVNLSTGNSAVVHDFAHFGSAFSPATSLLAIGDDVRDGGVIVFYGADEYKPVKEIRFDKGPVDPVVYSPDGHLMAVGLEGVNVSVKILKAEDGSMIADLEYQSESSVALSFSSDNQFLASTSRDRVRIWQVETGQLLMSIPFTSGRVNSTSFSPDGRWLAVGLSDGTVRIFGIAP